MFIFARRIVAAAALCAYLAISGFGQQQQCDDAAVTGYTVRSVIFRARAGRVPDQLKSELATHRGESDSSLKGTGYAEEIKKYLAENPAQLADAVFGAARLNAIQIKVSLYEWCATPLPASVCQSEFKGSSGKCVDVAVTTKAVKLDVGDIS